MKNKFLFCAVLAAAVAQLHAQGTGLVVSSSNTVGIGTSTPAALLDLSNANNATTATSYDPGSGTSSTIYVGTLKSSSAVTSLSGTTAANFDYLLVNPSATTSQQIANRQFVTTIPAGNSTSFSSTIFGAFAALSNYGSGYTGILIGQSNQVRNFGAGSTINEVVGNSVSVGNGSNSSQNSVVNYAFGYGATMLNGTTNGLISNRYGVYVGESNLGTITNDYGLYVVGGNSGTITNGYGLYLTGVTSGTHTNTPYDIYAADSGTNNYFAGNVGIGTANPQANLQVAASSYSELRLTGVPTNGGILEFVDSGGTTNARILGFGSSGGGDANALRFDAGGSTERMRITGAGNVGIGTASPGYMLDVAGQVHATSFVSSTTTYADFVFKPDYKLAPLNEVEASIKKEGHLPGIPSAEEAKAHGIDITQMQVKLLQKIEELTLHQIEQEKRIERLEKENTELREKLTK